MCVVAQRAEGLSEEEYRSEGVVAGHQNTTQTRDANSKVSKKYQSVVALLARPQKQKPTVRGLVHPNKNFHGTNVTTFYQINSPNENGYSK